MKKVWNMNTNKYTYVPYYIPIQYTCIINVFYYLYEWNIDIGIYYNYNYMCTSLPQMIN